MRLLFFVLLIPVVALPQAALRDKSAIYREAFAGLPELSKQGQAQMSQWSDIPFDTSVEQLLTAYEPSLQLMHEALTAGGDCDWRIDLEKEGLATRYPQAGPSFLLARAALLRARRSMTFGRVDWALSDVQAVRRMARDIATTEVLVTIIAAYSVENMAIEFLQESLSSVPAKYKVKLLDASRSLPLLPTTSRAVHQERAYYRWLVRHLHKASTEDRLPLEAKALFERLGVPQTFQQLQGFTTSWKTDIKEAYDLQGKLSEVAAAPTRTRLDDLAAFEARRPSWTLLSQLMVPNISKACEQEMALKAKRRKLDMSLQQ